jgi:hypothetical protein
MTLVLNGTTGVSSVDGSASTPAIQGNDSNTGVFFPAADTVAIATGGTERARVDSSGNVGIGMTPSAWASTWKPIQLGSGAAFSGRTDNVQVAYMNANSYRGASNWTYVGSGRGAMYLQDDGMHIWYNSASGTAGNTISWTQVAQIDTSGNLLVGKTTTSTSSGIGYVALATGETAAVMSASANTTTTNAIYSTGASAYRFYVGLGGTVYATSTTITGISDQRLKENIRDLDDGLDAVLALKPRKFDWKEGKGANIKNARGFIAQEFETVFPDMIEEWRDPAPNGEEPYKAVNANLIPTLVKAIQELNAKVEALEAQLAGAAR